MIVITGAFGFIGSNMVEYLTSLGRDDLVLIDLPCVCASARTRAYPRVPLRARVHPWSMDVVLPEGDIDGVVHLGAISDTLEKDKNKIDRFNREYTSVLASSCKERRIPMVFASTAAVYGNGSGPLNLYAQSKFQSEVDIADDAVCFRLFNVYGKNEFHKGRMSSVILKWWKELQMEGSIRLFEGSNEYRRDFVHVLDVCRVMWKGMELSSGVYDLGTGTSHSFDSLADMVIGCHGSGNKVSVPMPQDLRDQYQTNTMAFAPSWMGDFIPLSEGVRLYCEHLKGKQWLPES